MTAFAAFWNTLASYLQVNKTPTYVRNQHTGRKTQGRLRIWTYNHARILTSQRLLLLQYIDTTTFEGSPS